MAFPFENEEDWDADAAADAQAEQAEEEYLSTHAEAWQKRQIDAKEMAEHFEANHNMFHHLFCECVLNVRFV